MKKPTPEEAEAATTVFWDINRCPLPPSFDARQVRPSIKRFLENLGFFGPLTITAVGILTHVPEDILRAVSSTEIVLHHVPFGTKNISSLLFLWSMNNKSPANLMVLSTSSIYSGGVKFGVLPSLSKRGFNVISPFEYDCTQKLPSTHALSLWIDFLILLKALPALEEDECSETGESSALWVCGVCRKRDGRGFKDFITHLSSRNHAFLLPLCVSYVGSLEDPDPSPDHASLKPPTPDAATSVFWDINRCPVPLGFDAHQVGPCIKWFLKDLGYSGPVTINAVGLLTYVPRHILRAVSSTGIVLNHVPCGSKDMERLLSRLPKSRAAANVMVISTPPSYSGFEKMKEATPAEAVAATSVFWDINRCPLPPGFDARQVRPSIKRVLEKSGYVGPLTITAVGILTHVPEDILRAVSSTGIVLHHVPFGTKNIGSLLFRSMRNNKSPANLMVLSTSPIYSGGLKFGVLCSLSESGVNVLYPFQYDCIQVLPSTHALSLWIEFIMEALAALEEDECRETGESSALWVCGVCYKCDGRGFKNFINHLSSRNHAFQLPLNVSYTGSLEDWSYPSSDHSLKPPTREEAVAATSVFWDINRCPVPLGFDAHQVGPCIKRFLKNLGYSGPLTINAVGLLTYVPRDILRAVSSTGIVLNHVPCGSKDMERLLSRLPKSPAAANAMVISTPPDYSGSLSSLSGAGLNVIYPFPYDFPQDTTPDSQLPLPFDYPYTPSSDVGSLWINFLVKASAALDEDKCRETSISSVSWVCRVCHILGRGFENFITHLASRKHARELPRWFSVFDGTDEKVLEERAEGPLHSYPDDAYLKAKRARARARARASPRARKRARASASLAQAQAHAGISYGE